MEQQHVIFKSLMETLIESSLPDFSSEELPLVADPVIQQSILCDLSNCCGMWKSSLNGGIDFLRKSTCYKNGNNKFKCFENKENLELNSGNSVQNACVEPASRWKGLVYKRKKPQRESTSVCNNVASKWGGFVYRRRKLSSSSLVKKTSNSEVILEEPKWGGFVYQRRKLSSSSLVKKESNSKVIFAKPLIEFNSAKEFCIYILKINGLLVDEDNSFARESSELKSVGGLNSFQSCKICGHSENPLKMLICDSCEGAFHLSCHMVKNLPVDYWFCQPCYREKSTILLRKSFESLADIMNVSRNYYGEGGPIICMLRDDQPFMSRVRIGEDYQAEISDWNGSIPEDFNSKKVHTKPLKREGENFSEHMPMIHPACVNLDAPKNVKKFPTSFIGNWVQCRNVIFNSSKNIRIICGKWRRAPLFVVQTDNWECSCCVLWDALHADCAVPQELETDVILDHLKYLEMLRPRLIS